MHFGAFIMLDVGQRNAHGRVDVTVAPNAVRVIVGVFNFACNVFW